MSLQQEFFRNQIMQRDQPKGKEGRNPEIAKVADRDADPGAH